MRSTEELTVACRELNATIGVISTPDEAAQGVCDQLRQRRGCAAS